MGKLIAPDFTSRRGAPSSVGLYDAEIADNGQMVLPFDEGLAQVLTAWRQHGLAAGDSERTLTSRRYTIVRLTRSGISPMTASCDDLTEWLSSLRDSRTGAPVTRSTKATYRSQLRAFYGWLRKTGRREDDPTEDLPAVRVGRNVPRPLSHPQVQAVLAACSDVRAHQTRAYVLLGAYLGLRVHEIAKIRAEDFDDDVLYVVGKGGKHATIPLHPVIVDLVEIMPRRGYWFPSTTQEGHVDRVSVSLAIKRAMVRAGVPGTPHALRHFYGTQALKASGGDLRMTQRLMRHSNPATTAIYTQVDDDSARRAVAGIPA